MKDNRDYYALYIKYKSKYLALKTGGAEPELGEKKYNTYIKKINRFYSTK
jgi:hypothetical protein